MDLHIGAKISELPLKLQNSMPPGGVFVTARGDNLDGLDDVRGGGAYLLLLSSPSAIPFTFKKKQHCLAPGWYLYAGSARGPGGVSARVARHMRHDKKPHWHIDAITTMRPPIAALCYPNGLECDLVGALCDQGGFSFPVPGFGSTDCRTCSSHLLAWRPR